MLGKYRREHENVKWNRRFALSSVASAVAIFAILGLIPLTMTAAEAPRFNRDIRPILARHCLLCHGPDQQEGGLRLDRRDDALAPLPSGHRGIVPDDAGASELVRRVTASPASERMPPEGRPSLTRAEVDTLTRWIEAGAAYEVHWAYVPPVRSPLPVVAREVDHPIDRFLQARFEREGIVPSSPADKATLLRRVTLDLTGLPPSPFELASFLADESPLAYERLVDRLLASPQFGARQAIGWLDLARYADSDGFPHDMPRVVWPYRDWVVDAFNQDMPFDEFTIKQLAGDLLANPTDADLIATGLHRNSRINTEAGVDPEEFRMMAVIDRVNTTATVWLGTTLGCAQCHSHKFDPITHDDYYRFLAYFNSGAEETKRDHAGQITNVSPRAEVLPPLAARRKQSIAARLLGVNGSERKTLERELAAIQPVRMLVMKDVSPGRATRLLIRGDFTKPAHVVAAGTPAVLGNTPSAGGADRLALARWLVDPSNPLVARVAMNRLWQQYFGQGIVATLDDFGVQAPLATHEDLLDWLATEFWRVGGRPKALHRLIVTSAAYRRSAIATESALVKDPANRLLARGPRVRLSAEVIRDVALAIGGVLDRSLAGAPVPAGDMRASGGPSGFYRRTIYATWKRQALDDMLVNFDAPSRDVCSAIRVRTNTPLQALNLLNDRVFVDAARGLAVRVLGGEPETDRQRLDRAFVIALSREPNPEERERLLAFVARRRAEFGRGPEAATALWTRGTVEAPAGATEIDLATWTLLGNVLLNLDETITKE